MPAERLSWEVFLILNPIVTALAFVNAAILAVAFGKTLFGRVSLVLSLLFGGCSAFSVFDYWYYCNCGGSAISPVDDCFFRLFGAPNVSPATPLPNRPIICIILKN